TANLSWQPPASNDQRSYLLYSTLTGLSSVPPFQTTAQLPTSGLTCFAVGTLTSGGLTGYTNLLCVQPGFTNISADAKNSSPVAKGPDGGTNVPTPPSTATPGTRGRAPAP